MIKIRLAFMMLLFVAGVSSSFAQNYDAEFNDADTTMTAEEQTIDIYDKFNPFLGGDSIRWKEAGIKFTGQYEEYYKSGKIKHKGYYNNGQLTTIYKNYYDNGQLERSFKVTDTRSCQMETYYKNGVLESKTQYFKGQVLTEVDYYPTGKMEYSEENDKSFEFYISLYYYYDNGNPQSSLVLADKKNKMYDSKEYWKNGNVKEEGKMFFNKAINDYQKNGTWIIYDNTGKKVGEEDYVKGQLNEERKF